MCHLNFLPKVQDLLLRQDISEHAGPGQANPLQVTQAFQGKQHVDLGGCWFNIFQHEANNLGGPQLPEQKYDGNPRDNPVFL